MAIKVEPDELWANGVAIITFTQIACFNWVRDLWIWSFQERGLTNETPRSPAAAHLAINSQTRGADRAVPDRHLDTKGGKVN